MEGFRGSQMRRREFIVGLGGTAAWPLTARAQRRQPAMPVIGYLSSRSSESDVAMLVAFRRGLNGAGYVEGQNVTIEYRFADGQYDRLLALGTDLIGRHVAVIFFAAGSPEVGSPYYEAWRLLRSSNIPIVFNGGGSPDPVRSGLVSSFNRPGGNITGIFPLNTLMGKFLGLLHELVPDAKTIAVLANLQGNVQRRDEDRELAATLGVQLLFFTAGSEGEIDAAFAAMNQQRAEALVVITSPFFVTRAKLIASLAGRYRVPAIYPRREFAEAGGLMSYGYDVADGYRLLGGYAGRILKGEKAGDLPVFQPTKFELVINLKTAKAIGFEIPVKVLALADEVIE
jgi:putative tryptophan/tyrosine transport system substrate-binding protein